MRVEPSHAVLWAIGISAGLIGGDTLLEHGKPAQVGMILISLSLTLMGQVVADMRGRAARDERAELAAMADDIRRALGEATLTGRRNALSIGALHDLQNDTLQLLAQLSEDIDPLPPNVHRIRG